MSRGRNGHAAPGGAEKQGRLIDALSSLPAALKNGIEASRRHFIYAMLFSALLNLLFIAPMLYMLQVYDRVIPTAGRTTLLFITLALLGALATLALLDAVRSRLLVRASIRLDNKLAGEIMRASLARPDLASQRIAKQALREFDVLRQVITGPAMVGLFDAPWVPVYILVAALIHPWIGVLAFVGAALSLLLAWRNERATSNRLQQANAAAGRAYAAHEFTVAQADVVRALGLREALVTEHLQDRRKMMELQAGASFDGSGVTAVSKFVRLALQSLALGLAALLAIDAKVSAGAVFASSFIVGRALAPIDQLVGSWRPIIQARGAYHTLRELFGESAEMPVLTRLPPPTGRLDVENLGVADPNGRPIIAAFTFSVAPGEMIAIVGPSGAGKSTLVRTIAGAAAPAAGTVRFDGADQRNWESERLAEYIGFMPQESSLFAGTIKDNIARFKQRLGIDPAAVDEAAVAAAKLAGAHEMILRLPGGYDYALGLGGRGLSAGQAQRIALARALYGDPPYVILDEPNASLDAEGDQQLVATLEELKKLGKTLLVVAHRLSVLPVVDKLMVVRDGRLAMYGERDEVLRKISPPPPKPRAVVGKVQS